MNGGATRTYLAAILAVVIALGTAASHAAEQSLEFEGASFVNKGLVGVGRVPASAVDAFGDTLGGFGSGMAVVPGSWHKRGDGSLAGTLAMLPDRGWNTKGTVDYAGRLEWFELSLHPFYGASTTRQDQVTMRYKGATRFRDRKPTTGLDPASVRPGGNGFPPLPTDSRGRIGVDDEAVVVPGDGTVWVSDEYGPYVYRYTLEGRLRSAIRPPEAFVPKRIKDGMARDDFSANSPPLGVTYDPPKGNPVSGRQNNQGMEGMAISPDRTRLFVLMQSALIQDLDATSAATIRVTRRNARMLAYNIATPAPRLVGEYVVQLPQFQSGGETLTAAQSELLALNDHQFLVLARDTGAGFSLPRDTSLYRSIDIVDIADAAHPATDIANTDFDRPDRAVAPKGVLDPSITPAAYRKFIDINDNAELNRFGLHNGPPNDRNDLYEKWESLAVVPAFDPRNPNDYFLIVASDNDFITSHGRMGGKRYDDGADVDTLILVYRVTLPTYVRPAK